MVREWFGRFRQSTTRSTKRVVLLFATLILLLIPAHTAFSFYHASQTLTANAFSTLQLAAPDSLTASAEGHAVVLDWNPGANGDGYTLFAASSVGSDCANVTWTEIAQVTDTAVNFADVYTPQGAWSCYRVKTSLGSWNSMQHNPETAVRLGFVATSIQIINGGDTTGCSGIQEEQTGQTGTLDCGDQIIITFNQPVDTTTGPDGATTVCANPETNILTLASTSTTGACGSDETGELGRLTGGLIGAGTARYAATYTWSNNDRSVNLRLGARIYGTAYATLSADTWTLMPTSETEKLLSAVGSYHVCDSNAGGGDCLPSILMTESAAVLLSSPDAEPTPLRAKERKTPAPKPPEPTACSEKPAPPEQLAPKENVRIRKGQTTLKWAPSECASSYTIVIRDANTKERVEKREGLTTLNYTTQNLVPKHSYTWQLIAINEFGRSRSPQRGMTTK